MIGTSALLVSACDGRDYTTEPSPIEQRSNRVVLDWSVNTLDVITAATGYANPLDAVRVSAMVHTAQHDAINAIVPAFETYELEATDSAADPVAAAASAAHGVLLRLFPTQQALLDERLALSIDSLPAGDAVTRGLALGEQAAVAIVERRSNDGADTPLVGGYEPGQGAGKYQPTPPDHIAFAPGWRNVTTFALTNAQQFRPGAPPALTSAVYATDFNEVKSVGQLGSTTRTADQSAYAKFWFEFSEIGWNRIARTVAASKGLGLQSTARLFALLNMAMADAYIAGWDAKYYHDFWRPITAIQAADTDGNDETAQDAAWEPAEPTPPVQDYPSTHSALGNAAAAVLAQVFGDSTSFSSTSPTASPANSSRSFTSFSAAADENADSRVMAGIHFRFAISTGQQLGRDIGEWTINHHLRAR
jgi:hypothetical protein